MSAAPVLYNGADGISPGAPLPDGTDILAAYIGAGDLAGQPDAARVWTRDEWNLYLDPASHLHVPGLRVLPIYVHNFAGSPREDAANATDAAADLGWAVGAGRRLVLDMETRVDPAYTRAMDLELARQGFVMMLYGSYHYVIQNPAPLGGYWPALLTSRRPSVLPAGMQGQQWQFGQVWDRDVFSQQVWDNCGRGLRRDRP